jgi:ribosomal protein S18 acetylase RimI-like enzyme
MHFKTINLLADQNICINFRADSYQVSFGTTDEFYKEDGAAKYLAWLEKLIQKYPNYCLHLWRNNEIVGQLEAQIQAHNPGEPTGYVNLFYIAPSFRGQGLGQLLDKTICSRFLDANLKIAKARVSKTNTNAIAFYQKQSWVIEMESPSDPRLWLIKKNLSE